MRNRLITSLIVLLTLFIYATKADAQQGSVNTNGLYWLSGTPNIGFEYGFRKNTSIALNASWNPFTFSENRKWKHILIQPEFRLWTKETFSGHFFGLHAHYAYYNVGHLPTSIFSDYMAEHRFQGWLAGAGLSYGYRWNFSRHWGLEATFGVGYAYLDYSKYTCVKCGEKLGSRTENYFGPTKAGISLIYNFGKKKKTAQPVEPVHIPVIIQEQEPAKPIIIYEPQFAVSFITPQVEAVKQRSEAGQAYLDFAVGRSEIVPSFKDNAAELKKIYSLIESVKNDPDATITGITITGYASPEGTYQSNLVLSEKRAAALKNQIKAICGFPERLFKVSGQGEDWAMLDTLVSRSAMVDKYAILEIIRGTEIYDGRERKLMKLSGGQPYLSMKADLFPRLRRSDYELHYTVLPLTVEKGKEVFRTNPSNLSLNEMFLIANTYDPGSDAFNEVFETAARIFPLDDVANLNAAASALDRKDILSATNYLKRVTELSAAYWNNMGVLSFLREDYETAANCFDKARQAGSGEASANLSELNKYKESLSKE